MDRFKKRLRRFLRFAKKRWYILLVILLAIVSLAYYWLRPANNLPSMSLTEVRTQTQAHKVASAEIRYDDHEVVIKLKDSGKKYESSYPNEYDDELVGLFEKSGVPVKAVEESFLSKVGTYSLAFLPMLVFLLLYYIIAVVQKRRKSAREVVVPPSTRFSDVGANEEVVEELKETLDGIKSPDGYSSRKLRMPKGILLYGDPGTGKTLLAQALAGEAGLPFFETSGPDLLADYANQSAGNIRALYERAQAAALPGAPSIVFIDEIDAVARKRSGRTDSGSTDKDATLNQLLRCMEGFGSHGSGEGKKSVLTVAATNLEDTLDPALLRRFPKQIKVPLPNRNGRKKIIELCLKPHGNMALSAEELQSLAEMTGGMSGARIFELVNEASREMYHNGITDPTLAMRQFQEAMLKVNLGPKRDLPGEEDKQDRAANCAAAQALVALSLPTMADPYLVSMQLRGVSNGAVLVPGKPDDHPISNTELQELMMFHLAGRAAEVLLYGEATSSSTAEVKKATEVAYRMVCEFGTTEAVPRFIDTDEWNRDPQAGDISAGANHLVETGMSQMIQFLGEQKDALEQIASKLKASPEGILELSEVKQFRREFMLQSPPVIGFSSMNHAKQR